MIDYRRLYRDIFYGSEYVCPPSDVAKCYECAKNIVRLNEQERFIIESLYDRNPKDLVKLSFELKTRVNEIERVKDIAINKLRKVEVRSLLTFGLTEAMRLEYEQNLAGRRYMFVEKRYHR